MAIRKVWQDENFRVQNWEGLSADTKPTLLDENTGSSFYCVDTGDYYHWHIDQWFKKKIMGEGFSSGDIKLIAGATAPTGWLICDGSLLSRTTFDTLFAAIGTTYGPGDGSTTFALPNLKGRIPVGYDSTQTEFNAIGKTGGAKTHTLTESEIPAHSHYFEGVLTSVSQAAAGSSVRGNTTGKYTSNTGGGQAHNNLQPYITLNYVIKA